MGNAPENTPKLLLHACCGPCSLEPVRALRERGIEPHIYYANSNIHPAEEYAHRLDTIRSWAREQNVALTEGSYSVDAWDKTAGRIGTAARKRFGIIADGTDKSPEAEQARQARCRACYRMRFEESAAFAAQNGFDALGSTLSVSPYQYTDIIRQELERAAARVGIQALFEDYRPLYDEATRRSREAGMYRQNFCGCRFSDEEAAFERRERKAARQRAQEAQRAARAARDAEVKQKLAQRKAERAEYDRKQARKRAILKQMREQARQ